MAATNRLRKINMESTNQPIEKENHLRNLHFWNFPGCKGVEKSIHHVDGHFGLDKI